jgi:hypothetical protein
MKTARYTSTLKGAGLAREYCYQSPVPADRFRPLRRWEIGAKLIRGIIIFRHACKSNAGRGHE